jgi:hypothetical protein
VDLPGKRRDRQLQSRTTNEFLGSRSSPFGTSPGFAVDAQDDLYVNRGGEVIGELNSVGETLVEEVDQEQTSAVATDTATGNFYVDNLTDVAGFAPTSGCTSSSPCPTSPKEALIERFGAGHLTTGAGLVVDAANGLVYVADSAADTVGVFREVVVPSVITGAVTSPAEGSATLNGTVDPEGLPITSCEFEYGTSTEYGSVAECSPSPGSGAEPVTVSARINVQLGGTYHYRLAAANSNGTRLGGDRTIQAGAVVEDESAPHVGATEATVSAHILAGGIATSYRVDYGTTTAYGSSTALISIGSPSETVAVTARLANLDPSAQYHYRFVALNVYGSAVGTDEVFATGAESGAAPSLPDGRAYELVSPREDTEVYVPDLHEAELQATGEFAGLIGNGYRETYKHYEASTDGNAVAYVGESPASGMGGSGATGNGDGNQYLARRGASGWETGNLELPAGGEEGLPFFWAFSDDLSMYTVETEFPITAEPSRPAGCNNRTTAYAHDVSGYHALVAAPTTPGRCEASGAGISANDNHTLLYSANSLTGEAQAGENFEDKNLYDSVGGHLYQVNVLPDGQPEQHPDAQFGGRSYYQQGVYEATFEHAVSNDGDRVFWTTLEGEEHDIQPGALYVRENDTQPQSPIVEGLCTVSADACTLQLDKAQPGAEGPSGGGRFWTASDDGSRVFFTDCRRLTANATAHPEEGCAPAEPSGEEFSGNDLYEYDFSKPEGERLTDLTVDHTADPLGADVQGVLGAGADGGRIYFIANGVLSGSNAEGKTPLSGHRNLYISQDGQTTFVATLATSDNHFNNLSANGSSGEYGGDWQMEPGRRTAQVAPAGNALGFMSKEPLTGYDSDGLPEVFVYEAADEQLICASCNPSGTPPVPTSEGWEEERNANVGVGGTPMSMERWINETGGIQIYFMTGQPLIPQDTNHRQDVYEWQSDGSGGCRQSGGCVSPISSVTTPGPATFVDASSNGEDVFFTQRASLVPQAIDEDVKLYDARVNGGFPEASQACSGTGCQGVPPAPPAYATPASETFAGIGNYPPVVQHGKAKPKTLTRSQKLAKALKACRKKKPKKKRQACEKQARKQYGPVKKSTAKKGNR